MDLNEEKQNIQSKLIADEGVVKRQSKYAPKKQAGNNSTALYDDKGLTSGADYH